VIIAYMLTVALLIPASGWIADRFGTKRIFFSAILLFSFGSLLCAAANSLGFLIFARVVQGLGGALMLPVGRLVVLRAYAQRAGADHELHHHPGLLGPLIGPTWAAGWWNPELALDLPDQPAGRR
jgi:MFS family permease